jgi:choline dehydrogenase-like flavoprotein
MFVAVEELANAAKLSADVVVVGAGPVGITTALELGRRGVDVLLIESGKTGPDPRVQTLGDAAEYSRERHASMDECTRRQLGGASVIWGGRCVPFDPVDFEVRTYIPYSNWPVGYADIVPYFQRASDYFRIGRAVFSVHELAHISRKTLVQGLPDTHVLSSHLERWSLPTNFGREYRGELSASRHVQVIQEVTCTEIETNDAGDHVLGLRASTLAGRALRLVARSAYVLACGGLDTTRLLLVSDRVHRSGLGNHSGHLGRYYMGHLSGQLARVHFSTPSNETIYGYDRDLDGTYLRRRFSFSAEFQHERRLNNIAAWLVNPQLADPAHRNGVLSFAYLALASPFGKFLVADAIRKAAVGARVAGRVLAHFANMARDLPRTLWFIPSFGVRRYLVRRRVPGFFQYADNNVYPLHYHAEQIPNPDSRVTLANETDELGMRRLRIDFRYTEQDVESVVRSHTYWDEHLRAQGCGYLTYLADDPAEHVWRQARDGFHQAGTTRMSAEPADGVVDPQCRVHGVHNLYVASSSNFVTSGQANSTFSAVAFALRMADHLRSTGR